MRQLTAETDFRPLLQASPLLLLQFGSAACGPCAAIRAKLDLWLTDHPGVSCRYVPIEDFPRLSAELGIFSVPTLVLFTQGRESLRECGYFSLDAFLARVERLEQLMA